MATIPVANTFVQFPGLENVPLVNVGAVKGGWLGVADIAARDAIETSLLSTNQVVLVASPVVTMYRWTGAAWEEVELGAPPDEYASFAALPVSAGPGDLAVVLDASGDAAVTTGPALYYGLANNTWQRLTTGLATLSSTVSDNTSAIARQGARRVTTPVFWRENKEVAVSAKVMSASESVEGLVVLVKGSVFTTAGTFTLDVTRGDTDASLLTGGTAIDVTALTLGANAVTLASSVTPGEGVEIIVTVTSNNEDLAGGTLYLVTETELA